MYVAYKQRLKGAGRCPERKAEDARRRSGVVAEDPEQLGHEFPAAQNRKEGVMSGGFGRVERGLLDELRTNGRALVSPPGASRSVVEARRRAARSLMAKGMGGIVYETVEGRRRAVFTSPARWRSLVCGQAAVEGETLRRMAGSNMRRLRNLGVDPRTVWPAEAVRILEDPPEKPRKPRKAR